MLFYFAIRNPVSLLGAFSSFFKVFKTIFIAFAFAYILNPIIYFFKKRLFSRIKNDAISHTISVFLTYALLILFLTILVWQLIPALVNNISFFATNFNSYMEQFSEFAANISSKIYFGNDLLEKFNESIIEVARYISGWFSNNFINIINIIFKTTDLAADFIVAFFLSIYMSLSRDKLTAQIKKVTVSLLSHKKYSRVTRILSVVNESFSGYISGVIVSALITGLLCLLCMSVFGLEYAPLISFIVTITDIIPYFGPFIGAAAGSVLLLLANPADALWFLIIILVLQQITSNIINPGIIGKATGLDSIYVILSIIIMGGFFGITGMITGVPVFVILLKAVKKFISLRTKEKSNENTVEG